jgi:hypothetical protein
VEDNRSAIWGGATIGLVIGLILGFFVGTYWMTVLYAVGIGAALRVVANILGWLSDRGRNRAETQPTLSGFDFSSYQLPNVEGVLREHSPAEFETTPNAAVECIDVVCSLEEEGWWRAGYDSLDSIYATHEALRLTFASTRPFAAKPLSLRRSPIMNRSMSRSGRRD